MFAIRPEGYRRRQQGFTLTEILVTTAIFAIIMLAALAVYDRSNQTFKTSTEAADLQQSTRIGFDKLVSEIRMAGFDYSRGGIPQDPSQAVQPDEQIEYAGATALVFRANFNYNTANQTCAPNGTTPCGNGLEPALTPKNVSGGAIFPYVTTSDSEIVAYVLRSATASANNGAISFYVDDYTPRQVFPSNITPAPASGITSHTERAVQIGGIDLTNQNPPYTLYRVTVADVHNNQLGTPVAENIRSLNFQYFSDSAGTTLLTDSAGAAITTTKNANGSPANVATANTGAIGGDGQYDPNNVGTTTNFADRTQRALIQSIRVSLVGMNANPDLQGYTNPTEPLAAFKSYRQYGLSSLVVPRNLGKTGFPEPTYNAPGPASITSICVGFCGAPVVTWTPPAVGGPVAYYQLQWDTNPQGAFANPPTLINDPTATSYTIYDDGASDVSQTRYYRIQAFNDNGPGLPSNPVAAVAQARTTPMAVAVNTFQASAGQPNQITLNWTVPTNHAATQSTLSCSGAGGSTDGSLIPTGGQEVLKYKIYRGETPNFDPTSSSPAVDKGVVILDFWTSAGPNATNLLPGATATFVDVRPASALPPANCKTYYYRIQVASRCARPGNNWNVSPNTSVSDFSPALSAAAIAGSASSQVTPNAPTGLALDAANTVCPISPNVCRIAFTWAAVTSDTSGAPTSVDTYRISRGVRLGNGTFLPDPLFGSNGQLLVDCSTGMCGFNTYTQQSNRGPYGYIDTAPQANGGGQSFQYQYTVAALGCNNARTALSPAPVPNPDPYSVESNAIVYPGCTFTPNITASGATGGNGSAGNPWVFSPGDYIDVDLTGFSINNVQFVTTPLPAGPPIPSLSGTVLAPGNPANHYRLVWNSEPQGSYMISITITDTNLCQQVITEYAEEQPPSPCAFLTNVAPPAPNLTTAGNTKTDTETFSITNSGSDPMVIASQTVTATWQLAVGDITHTDLKLHDISFNGSPVNPGATLATPAPTVTAMTMPASAPAIAPGATVTLVFHFQYAKSDDNGGNPVLAVSPLKKVCINYTIASEPGTTKHCNLVGQSASTANPNSCD